MGSAALAFMLSAAPGIAAPLQPLDPLSALSSKPRIESGQRYAQRGGGCWYAVLHCSRGRADANRWSRQNGGEVINTSSDEFPNFQRGYYCVVNGPMSRDRAQGEARRWRNSGVSRDAYAKDSGC
jgi:hypothetical protein